MWHRHLHRWPLCFYSWKEAVSSRGRSAFRDWWRLLTLFYTGLWYPFIRFVSAAHYKWTPLDIEILSVPSSSISVPTFSKKIQSLLPLSVQQSQLNLQSQSSSQTTSSSGPQWGARYPESTWGWEARPHREPGSGGGGGTFQAWTWALTCFTSSINVNAKKSHSSSSSSYLTFQGCIHLSKPCVQ